MEKVRINKTQILLLGIKKVLKGNWVYRVQEGKIFGLKDGEEGFNITINETEAFVSASVNNPNIFNSLVEVTSAVMGAEPVLGYLQTAFGIIMKTYEWDVLNPDKRIRDIIEENNQMVVMKIQNLELFGGRKMEDYTCPKVYGKYKGIISQIDKKVEKFNELDLFIEMAAMLATLPSINSEEQLEEYEYGYEYLIYQTTKFGVQIPEPKEGRHVEKTDEFNAWFAFWGVHVNSMSDEELNNYLIARENNSDISSFMPKGDWHDFIDITR